MKNQDILYHAFFLFMKKGYKAFTLQELEKITGLTKGAFYHHYRNKEEIIHSAIRKYCFSLKDRIDPDTHQDLRSYLSERVDLFEKKMLEYKSAGVKLADPYYLTLLIDAREFIPSLKEEIKTQYYSQISQWEKVIVRAKETGEIKGNIESTYFAEIFISIGMGVIKNMLLDEEPISTITAKMRIYYDQIYQLLRNPEVTSKL